MAGLVPAIHAFGLADARPRANTHDQSGRMRGSRGAARLSALEVVDGRPKAGHDGRAFPSEDGVVYEPRGGTVAHLAAAAVNTAKPSGVRQRRPSRRPCGARAAQL